MRISDWSSDVCSSDLLEDILGPALFRRTAEAAAPLGLATETLQRLKPWALGLAFTLPPLERVRAAKGEPAYDAWLQAEGRRRGKTLQALETYDEQNEVFDGLREAEQVEIGSGSGRGRGCQVG